MRHYVDRSKSLEKIPCNRYFEEFLIGLQSGFGPIVAKLSASMFHIRYTLGRIGLKPILIYKKSKTYRTIEIVWNKRPTIVKQKTRNKRC